MLFEVSLDCWFFFVSVFDSLIHVRFFWSGSLTSCSIVCVSVESSVYVYNKEKKSEHRSKLYLDGKSDNKNRLWSLSHKFLPFPTAQFRFFCVSDLSPLAMCFPVYKIIVHMHLIRLSVYLKCQSTYCISQGHYIVCRQLNGIRLLLVNIRISYMPNNA